MLVVNRRWIEGGGVAAALVAGLALARLPLLPVIALVLGGAVVLATLVEPLAGLGLTLVAAPFVAFERFMWHLPLDSGQALLMLTLGAWLLRGLARRSLRIPRAPLLAPLLVFTLIWALSLWNAVSLEAGLRELLKWVEVIAVYLLVVDAVGDRRLPWVIALVLLAASVQAALGVWQFGLRGQGPAHFQIAGTPFYRAYGGFEQPNPFAGYMGLALPLAIGVLVSSFKFEVSRFTFHVHLHCPPGTAQVSPFISSRKVPDLREWGACRGTFHVLLLAACCLLLAAALVASWSRGAWLGAAVASGAMAAFWPRRWWLGVGAVSMAASLVLGAGTLGLLPGAARARLADLTHALRAQVYDVRGVGVNDANYSVVERLAHWQAAGEMIRWHPWLGVGLGNYEAAYESYRLLNWPYALGHAHNTILNVTAETGLLGLLAYAGLWSIIFWQTFQALGSTSGWRRGLALGCLGVWVHLHAHNMFDNLYVSNLWIHLAVLLGLLTVVRCDTQHAIRNTQYVTD
jgi:putative inorganic carbon (HCO3(-)) transporter